jgi:hypothetical protein
VTALEPLTLRTASGITTRISDLAGVEFHRWGKVELAEVSPGDRIGAVAEQGQSAPLEGACPQHSPITPGRAARARLREVRASRERGVAPGCGSPPAAHRGLYRPWCTPPRCEPCPRREPGRSG